MKYEVCVLNLPILEINAPLALDSSVCRTENMDIQKCFYDRDAAIQYMRKYDMIASEMSCTCKKSMTQRKKSGKLCWMCSQCGTTRSIFTSSIFKVFTQLYHIMIHM